MRTANILINQGALTHNLAQVNKLAPNSKVLAMVKANAYGHGVAMCLPALTDANAIGVATLAEAIQAKQLGWAKHTVLIEGVFSQAEWQTAINNHFMCVIHQQQQLDWALQNIPKHDCQTKTIWLKLNTGMNRLGFNQQSVIEAAKQLTQAGYQLILTSHFANADDKSTPLNEQQGTLFSKVFTQLQQQVDPNIKGSLCNSAAIINFPNWHFDWVRPGIMLYGSSPVVDKTSDQLNLKPVMTLQAKIMAVHQLNTGEMVGYGSRWKAQKPSRVGIVSIGYGDGYPRVVDNTAWVAVTDTTTDITTQASLHKAPIIGRVAMDMIVIDLTDLPASLGIDSIVTLWGAAPQIDEVAQSANTISYELLCRLTTRPTRKLHKT